MKKRNVLLIAALTSVLCLSACGKGESEETSAIQDITVEVLILDCFKVLLGIIGDI